MKDTPLNIPRKTPIRIYLRCIDASPSEINKEVKDTLKKGEIYMAYAVARPMNSDSNACFYITDMAGKTIEAFEGVPTWNSDRFKPLMKICMN